MACEVQSLHVGGKRFVVLEAEEYERLCIAAGVSSDGPPLPEPSPSGHYPAAIYAQASLARKLIARRKKAGLSIEQLARKSKVTVQTIRKLEAGTATVSVAAVDKLDRALTASNA
jgi:DNA-binding XRE family transcriptional regulator